MHQRFGFTASVLLEIFPGTSQSGLGSDSSGQGSGVSPEFESESRPPEEVILQMENNRKVVVAACWTRPGLLPLRSPGDGVREMGRCKFSTKEFTPRSWPNGLHARPNTCCNIPLR
ncbi:hypothetical protein GE09DRAFT_710549 [Coniochaeta sp. 2T2.1]|nr:hypothetical protein GE09DRAFT_710549 [Coniochaeta sp. 2T2.1]